MSDTPQTDAAQSAPLFGVSFFTGTASQAIEIFLGQLKAPSGSAPCIVFTPNTEQLMMAENNPEFLSTLQQSDLNLPDSAGVVWAGKMLQLKPFPRRRIAGRELVEELLPHLAMLDKKLFLLGGKGGVAQLAAKALHATFPDLKVGSDRGAVNAKEETPKESAAILREITTFTPDVLFVAYGAPSQELWTLKYKEELGKAGVKIVMVVGGTLDLLAGLLTKPPEGMSANGLEWLWRVAQQPWRLVRQLALPVFAARVLKERFAKKI